VGAVKISHGAPATCVTACSLFLLLFFAVFPANNHLYRYIRWLGGYTLIVWDSTRSVGRLEAGRTWCGGFRITNCSPAPVRLLGSRCSCSCFVVDDLPLTIAPGSTVVLTARAKARPKMQTLEGHIDIFTDSPVSPVVQLSLAGTVVPEGGLVVG